MSHNDSLSGMLPSFSMTLAILTIFPLKYHCFVVVPEPLSGTILLSDKKFEIVMVSAFTLRLSQYACYKQK
jgi:hypothetical protein